MKAKTIIVLLLCTQAAFASSSTTTRVTSFGIYGDARVYVNVADEIDEAGCQKSRFDLSGAHPAAARVLELARVAAEGDKQVVVKTAGCLGSFPTFATDTSSHFSVREISDPVHGPQGEQLPAQLVEATSVGWVAEAFYANVSQGPTAFTCTNNTSLRLHSDHPMREEIVSIVLSAFHARTKILFYVNGCVGASPRIIGAKSLFESQ